MQGIDYSPIYRAQAGLERFADLMDQRQSIRKEEEAMKGYGAMAADPEQGYGAAAQQALQDGRFDVAANMQQMQAQLAQMDDAKRTQATQQITALASLGNSLKDVPMEARPQFLQQYGPQLQQAGVDISKLDQNDLTDEGVQQMIMLGQIVGGGGEQMTPYQQAQMELNREKFDYEREQDSQAPQREVSRVIETDQGYVTVYKDGTTETTGLNAAPDEMTPYQRESLALRRQQAQSGGGTIRLADGTVIQTGGAKPVEPSKEGLTRFALGLPNLLNASDTLLQMEREGYNLEQDLGAEMASAIPGAGQYLSRKMGGEDYQQYQQARATYESQILPILSGAAVTDSEARRFIKAALPQAGDGPAVEREKQRFRQNMNAALEAMVTGKPYDLNAMRAQADAVLGGARGGGVQTQTAQAGGNDLPAGFREVP